MKLRFVLISLAIILLPVAVTAHADGHRDKKEKVRVQRVERTAEADPGVTVSLCVESGSITVRGWNKNTVLARSSDVGRILLNRGDLGGSGPATMLTVLMGDAKDDRKKPDDCQAFGDVELMVPTGASVHVQTGDGAINIADVASVYAKSQTGDIEITKASRSVEAVSFSSDVWIRDSTGRMVLKSVGGTVTATSIGQADSGDCLDASTVSGDIELDQVSHPYITARSVNGEIHFAGPLKNDGQYTFNTTKGDVTLTLPVDTSFRLNARVSQEAEVTSDFPLTLKIEAAKTSTTTKVSTGASDHPKKAGASPDAPEPPVVVVEPKKTTKVNPIVVRAYTSRRVTAVHGTGTAVINVVSFTGSLHLQKEDEE